MAILVSLLDQLIFWFVVFSGSNVYGILYVVHILTEILLGIIFNEVGLTNHLKLRILIYYYSYIK